MSCTVVRCALIALALIGLPVAQAGAERATNQEMEAVCLNWMRHIVHETGDWAGVSDPVIRGRQDILEGDVLLGRCFSISPSGYVVVPSLKALPPVKAYSEQYDLDFADVVGYPQLLREVLHHRVTLYRQTYGSLDVAQPVTGEVLFDRVNRVQWDLYLLDETDFLAELDDGALGDRMVAGPLMTTQWHQGAPYNELAPIGDGGQCLVGCVATAASQLMCYYQWPPAGVGDHSYWWDGDNSCGGSTPGEELYADFSDPFDWDNMRNSCNSGCSEDEEAAMAELCYEVAVGFEMDFGHCGSGAYTSYCAYVLPTYFQYQDIIDQEYRSSHTPQSWFVIIQHEINNGRPALYSFQMAQTGHAVVCDGWSDDGGVDQIHLNYGWGGDHNSWYTLDNIYGSIDPALERLYRYIMPPPQTYVVTPDGTGDFPTIQDAVTAAFEGCIIELTDGIFTGDGNRDIHVDGRQITIRSQSGNPEACILDCQGDPENLHSGFVFEMGEGPEVVIEELTITNAQGLSGGAVNCNAGASPSFNNCIFSNSSSSFGGGMICLEGASPTLNACVFQGNAAGTFGGAMRFRNASATLNDCTFYANSSSGGGGAVECRNSSPAFYNCTFVENGAQGNGGIILLKNASNPVFQKAILAFATQGEALYLGDDTCSPALSCCDVFGNVGGPGDAAPWIGNHENIDDDPLFCDASSGDLTLCADSPCLASHSPCGELIGALGEGCGSCGSGSDVADVGATPTLHLSPCRPNPFASSARIAFALPGSDESEPVSLRVYDGAGRVVRVLVEKPLSPGFHTVLWDGMDGRGNAVSSGIYFYQLRWKNDLKSGRMLLIR